MSIVMKGLFHTCTIHYAFERLGQAASSKLDRQVSVKVPND